MKSKNRQKDQRNRLQEIKKHLPQRLNQVNNRTKEHLKDTSWANVALWYDNLLKDKNSYQSQVVLPNIKRLFDVHLEKLKLVADIGCGTGFFSIELAKSGYKIIGIDSGDKLIEKAKSYVLNQNINDANFFTKDASNTGLIDNSVDAVMCVLALQNIRDAEGAVSEWARIIKKSGPVVLVLNHPNYRIPKASSWGWDSVSKSQFRRVDKYLSEFGAEIKMNPSSDQSAITYSFHRPLQWYSKVFEKNGFTIERIEEWISHKYSEPGQRKEEEDRIRKEIPMFMCLLLRKK